MVTFLIIYGVCTIIALICNFAVADKFISIDELIIATIIWPILAIIKLFKVAAQLIRDEINGI